MSIQTVAAADSISAVVRTASICNDSEHALATPIPCSTECPARENNATGAIAAPSASPTSVVHCGGSNEVDFTAVTPIPVVVVTSAVDVDDHSVANKHEVTLPLKLLELSPLQTNGQNVLTLLPQVAQAMVSWGTSMNQCTTKISGMCSGLCCATNHSVCLLPLDPGEKPMILRDSVFSRDIAWHACVKKLNADLSDSHDHDQKSGYANTQTYLHWFIHCGSETMQWKIAWALQCYYIRRIRVPSSWIGTIGNAFICGSSHFQWYIAWSYTLAQADVRTIHLARPTISLITTEAPASDPSIATVRLFTVWTSDLIIYICVEQIEAHLSRSCDQHQKKSGASLCNCSSISSIVPAPSVSCTWNTLLLVEYSRGCSEQEGSGNLCGKCLQQVEFEPRPLPWPSFEHDQDGWQQRQSPHQLLSRLLVNFDYSLEAWVVCYIDGTWVSRFGRLTYADDSFVYGCEMTNGSHHKKPWDPGGILSRAWIFQWQVVLIHCKSRLGGMHSTLQWSPLQVNCHFAKIQIVLLTRAQMNEEINCETSLDLVVSCRNPAWTLAYTSSWRLMFTGFLLQCGPEAGVLLLISPGHPVTIHCAGQGYTSSSTFLAILNERAKVQQHYICTRVVIEAVQLLNKQSSSNHAIVWSDRTNLIDHRAIITIVWSNQLMKLKRRIDEEKGRRNAAAPVYYSGHCLDHVYYFDKACAYNDYYLDVISEHVHIGHIYYMGFFREQLHVVCYLYLAKVCLDYNTHRNLGEVMKHRALWDPGGSTWRRLEVKPKIKEGGMLATIPCYAVGWNVLCFCWAWASRKPQEASATYTRGWLPEDSAWNWTASASSASISSSSRSCFSAPL